MGKELAISGDFPFRAVRTAGKGDCRTYLKA